MTGTLDKWQLAFREGFAPRLPVAGLVALRDALAADDPRIIQGQTTWPPPCGWNRHYLVWACCPLSFVGAAALGGLGCTAAEFEDRMFPPITNAKAATVGDVAEWFAGLLADADEALPGASKAFLCAWDDTPRDRMRLALLAEVERAAA